MAVDEGYADPEAAGDLRGSYGGYAGVVRAESDDFVASLRERGVPAEYLLAEDEGHGFENPENRIRLHHAIERHFAEHLGGARLD